MASKPFFSDSAPRVFAFLLRAPTEEIDASTEREMTDTCPPFLERLEVDAALQNTNVTSLKGIC